MYIVQFIDGGLVSSPTQFTPAEAFDNYCTMVSIVHNKKLSETEISNALTVWFEEMVQHHEFHISYVVSGKLRELDQFLVTSDGRS